MRVRVRTSTLRRTVVAVGIQGPPGTGTNIILENLRDIDTTNLTDGAVLVYNASTRKWVAQTVLNKQQIDVDDETY